MNSSRNWVNKAGMDLNSSQLLMGGEPLCISDHSQSWYTIEDHGIEDRAMLTLSDGESDMVDAVKRLVARMENIVEDRDESSCRDRRPYFRCHSAASECSAAGHVGL